jgi:hypothetical protein
MLGGAAEATDGAIKARAARTQVTDSTRMFLTVANECVFGGDRTIL